MRPQPTKEDLELETTLDEQATDIVLAARLVVHAALDPECKISPHAIAEKCGISPWKVEQLLSSKAYTEILMTEAKERVAGSIMRHVGKLSKMLDAGDMRPNVMVQSLRAMTDTYKTLNDYAPKHQAVGRKAQLDRLYAEWDETVKLADYEVTNDSNGSP